MIKPKYKLDPVFLVIHPGLPTMSSGSFSSDEIAKIHNIGSQLLQETIPVCLINSISVPGWVLRWARRLWRTGMPLPELSLPCDSEAGPDPERMKFVLDTSNSKRLGSTGAAIGLAIATELDIELPDRVLGGKVFRAVTDLQLAVMYAGRTRQGSTAGYYELMNQVWRAEISAFSHCGIELLPSAVI